MLLRRFLGENVERRARDLAAFQRRFQIGFDNQAAPRAVDDAHALLAFRQRFRVDDVFVCSVIGVCSVMKSARGRS